MKFTCVLVSVFLVSASSIAQDHRWADEVSIETIKETGADWEVEALEHVECAALHSETGNAYNAESFFASAVLIADKMGIDNRIILADYFEIFSGRWNTKLKQGLLNLAQISVEISRCAAFIPSEPEAIPARLSKSDFAARITVD